MEVYVCSSLLPIYMLCYYAIGIWIVLQSFQNPPKYKKSNFKVSANFEYKDAKR